MPDINLDTSKEKGDVIVPTETVSEDDDAEANDDIHFEPLVSLPEVVVSTNEENEEELVKLRARLFRFVAHEWKERGTGDIKLLRHRETNSVRVVMRRDKTLKICANHFITPDVQLNPHCNSEKDFNWTCFADFADEQPRSELFAIRFGNVENARTWKMKFEEAKEIVKTRCSLYNGADSSKENETLDEEGDSDGDSQDGDSQEENSQASNEISKAIEDLSIQNDT